MADQSQESLEPVEEIASVDATEAPREISESEKRLRRELARSREQVRIAQSERDAALAAAVRERDEAVAAAREQARERVLQAELRTHAIRAGIVDLDALKLAELSSVSFDEAGEIVGVEEVVATLRARKPYLFGSDATPLAPSTTAQTQRAPHPAQPSVLDARALSREAWQAERDRLISPKR